MHPIIVCLVAGISIFGSKYLLQQLSTRPNTAKQELANTIKELKEQAEELNNPSTFAAFSKLQRRINTLEQQLGKMKEQSTSSEIVLIIKIMPYVFAFLFLGSYYNLNIHGADIYWPLNSILGYQEGRNYMLSLFS
mmetsp:Transcript_9274/g.9274  ORF Transcript_9274/g.9274 Transcript_9274/m.9274 type:complete len:136 (+) Transcript_9274:49-456(+)